MESGRTVKDKICSVATPPDIKKNKTIVGSADDPYYRLIEVDEVSH